MQHIQGWRSRTVGILQSLKVCRVLIIAMFTIDQRKCGLPQLRCLDSAGIYHQPQASRAYPSASSVCTNSSTCPANNVPCPLPKPSVGNGYTHSKFKQSSAFKVHAEKQLEKMHWQQLWWVWLLLTKCTLIWPSNASYKMH